MAQLNDLLVMGQSTLLGPVKITNNLLIQGGTFTLQTASGSTRWSISSLGEAIIQGNITLRPYNDSTPTDLIILQQYSDSATTFILNDQGNITFQRNNIQVRERSARPHQ